MNKDIELVLRGWNPNPDEVTVRRIRGLDGSNKIQMRLDLGVLQMEVEGRPDGKRPYGYESLLDYYEHRLERYRALNGDDTGFSLDSESCTMLKQESMQYYYRYLSSFHLGDYESVITDTERNLRAFDFILLWAKSDDDRSTCEQFRPYALMMNTRANACVLLEAQLFDEALDEIAFGIERIEDFFLELERSDLLESCRELAFLREWSERIQDNRPLTDAEKLRRELSLAVECEDYEKAAQLRDQLKELAL